MVIHSIEIYFRKSNNPETKNLIQLINGGGNSPRQFKDSGGKNGNQLNKCDHLAGYVFIQYDRPSRKQANDSN